MTSYLPTWLRRIAWITLAIVIVGLVGAYSAYRATQWIPPFYDKQLGASRDELQQAGNQLERQLQQLQQQHVDARQWTSIFSEEEVNGWLAVNLPVKFPRLLPHTIREPRIELKAGNAHIACQYVSPKMTAVLSLQIDARATDQPNIVAIYLRDARIGAVPGLVQLAMDEIDSAAKRAGVQIEWVEDKGDQVALVTVPDHVLDADHRFELQDVEIADGELKIAGTLVPVR